MYSLLKSFNEQANKAVEFVVKFTFTVMTVLIFFQVIFRYVLQASLSWSEELARYFFIWLTFIGASIPIRERSHINVSMLIDSIKNSKIKKGFKIFANLLSMFFLIVLIRYGLPIALRTLELGQTSPSMPFLKIGIIYFAIPIGSFLMVMNLIEICIGLFLERSSQPEGGHH